MGMAFQVEAGEAAFLRQMMAFQVEARGSSGEGGRLYWGSGKLPET
jgi:hypothetical protein